MGKTLGAAQTRPPMVTVPLPHALPWPGPGVPLFCHAASEWTPAKSRNGGEADGKGNRDRGERWEETWMRPTGGKEGMEEVGTREEPRVLQKVGLEWGDASWLLLLLARFSGPPVTNPRTMAPPAVGREQHR